MERADAQHVVAADASANMEMMDNRYTYMRHPILLRFYSFVGINYVKRNAQHGARGGHIDVRVSVIPVYVWWNPYNVDMTFTGADGGPWGSYFGEHRFMPMVQRNNFGQMESFLDNNWENKNYGEHPLTPYSLQDLKYGPNRQIADFGASFRETSTIDSSGLGKAGASSTLKAGEIVVFAQPVLTADTSITKAKTSWYDCKVDNFAFKEGWSQDPRQTKEYNIHWADGVQYQYLSKSGYEEMGTALMSIRFAESLTELNHTPADAVLCTRFTEEFSAQSKKLGTFVMLSGLMDSKKIGTGGESNLRNKIEIDTFFKTSPTILNLNWGAWEKPLLDQVKLPADMFLDNEGPDDNRKRRGFYGTAAEDSTFVAYYGVSVKWGKTPVIGTYPEGKDYRAKTWQHSSPLFWGSQMPTASELGRSYSPYQFEVKNANSDFFPITISNILSNDGTRLSPFGGPGAEQVNKIVAAELPFQQPSSLAGFAGFRLTPGWYKTDSKAAIAKRFAYQSGVPGVGIGNSFADPMLPPDKVFSHNEIMGDASLGDFWDHGLMINDALWDSWFTSSLAARPRSIGGSAKEDLKSVLKEAFSTDTSSNKAAGIANRRLSPDLQGKPAEAVIDELAKTDEGYKLSAKYLPIAGGFNVNSTSRRAWEAMLMGLKNRKLLYSSNGRPSVLSGNQANFSRFGVASSNKSHVDDYGSIGITNGIPDGDAMAWSDLRTLSDTQIRALADNMVKEVKKRGPFLNMSDFINRRLQSGEMGVKGALQAAIDESSINRTFDELTDMVITPKVGYPNADAAKGSVFTAAPGYLIQSDVLAVLGNILTTRDDTFTIRAYGEVTSREGVVLSRAWCEAVVQRGINYVDPVNSPETAATKVNMKTGALEGTDLSAVNKAFGRRFNIVSFRWLSPEEV